MTEDNKKRNIESAISLADRKLRDAEGLYSLGGYGTCLSAAYYCAFHYASALLMSEGLESKTHRGLVHMVGQHFAQSGRLKPQIFALLSQLYAMRQDADYNSGSVFTEDMAAEWLQKTRSFRDEVRGLLSALGYL